MKLTDNQKEYVKSSVITFLSAVGVALLADIDNISLDTLKDGSFVVFVYVWVRAGLKAFVQFCVTWASKRKK